MPCNIEQTLDSIKLFDHSTPWMYLDARGRVTVGAGMVLPNAASAARLPFQVGSRAATQDDIAREFARLETSPAGRPAQFYRNPGGPQLEPAVMDTLLRTALVGFEDQMREHIPCYDDMPSAARMALLDMAHSLTPAVLVGSYPRLLSALKIRAWPEAAAHSFRPGVGASRNQWTAATFRACLEPSRENPWKRLAYGLIGLTASLLDRIWDRP